MGIGFILGFIFLLQKRGTKEGNKKKRLPGVFGRGGLRKFWCRGALS
jgi:hypothetical protein